MKLSVATIIVMAGLLVGGVEALAGGKFFSRSNQGSFKGSPHGSGFRPTISPRLFRGLKPKPRGIVRSRFSGSPRRSRKYQPPHHPFTYSPLGSGPIHRGGFGRGVFQPWGVPQKPFVDPTPRFRSARNRKFRDRSLKARFQEIPHSHFNQVYRKGNSFSNYPISGWDAVAGDATPLDGISGSLEKGATGSRFPRAKIR